MIIMHISIKISNTQFNAGRLALSTGGSIKKFDNHIISPRSRPGLYFDHYHGVGLNGERVLYFLELIMYFINTRKNILVSGGIYYEYYRIEFKKYCLYKLCTSFFI
ncbi:hypothetical protein SH2C18_15150 [Clostridium sediminicola]